MRLRLRAVLVLFLMGVSKCDCSRPSPWSPYPSKGN